LHKFNVSPKAKAIWVKVLASNNSRFDLNTPTSLEQELFWKLKQSEVYQYADFAHFQELIEKINTMEANAFLVGYIDGFSEQFSVESENSESVFRQLEDGIDLSTILCVKEDRLVTDGSGFSYGGLYYQLTKDSKIPSLTHKASYLYSHKKDPNRLR